MRILIAGLICTMAIASPQDTARLAAPSKPKPSDPDAALNMRGDRLPPIKYKDMTPAQKAMADRAIAGRGAIGDFSVILRSPELADAMRISRANTSLSAKQSELAILINARYWTSQFEWMVHHRAAVQAGLSEETIGAIAEGRRPAALKPDEETIYSFLQELITTHQVSNAAFAAAKDKLGEKGIVDLFGLVGFYQVASLMMNTDRYPMPNADQKPELKELAKPVPVVGAGFATAPETGTSAPGTKTSIVGKYKLELRGDRFRALSYEEMTPGQKAVTDKILAGEIQGGTGGPLNVLLRGPDVAEGVARYSDYIRFHSTLPIRLNELAALITIRYWGAQFPFSVHHRAATQAGLNDATIAAIADGKRPASLEKDEEIVYNFVAEVLKTAQISDGNFTAAKELLGERNLVELLGVVGYYQIVSMVVNTDRYPLPEGSKAELRPLASPLP
jgi:4-carboxymuconolactone decarboxylase